MGAKSVDLVVTGSLNNPSGQVFALKRVPDERSWITFVLMSRSIACVFMIWPVALFLIVSTVAAE